MTAQADGAHELSAFALTDRLAVVTGARRGIGLAMAEALAAAGADVVAVSAGQEADGGATRERVEAHGRRFWGLAGDLGDRASVRALVERIDALDRTVDILVNNAGTIHRAPAVEHPDDAWDRVLEVNLTAPFLLARELGAGMIRRGRGKVIFTASLLSFQGGVTVPGYAASKHGVAGLVKALANEWAPHGVNVNGIAVDQVDRAVAAGARFVVAPGFDVAVVRRCREHDVAVLPGVATATDVMAAMRERLDVVKLFPAGALGGVAMVDALAGPFPGLRFVPTGGIAVDDVPNYLARPSVLAVGGSWVAPRALLRARRFEDVTRLAADAVAAGKAARASEAAPA